MLLLKILLATMNVSFANLGGSVVPNGGNSVLCPASVVNSEILVNQYGVLDTFEGKYGFDYTFRKLASLRGRSLEEAFDRAVSMFLKRSPSLTASFREQFIHRSRFIEMTDSPLEQLIPVSWHAMVKGCEVQQVAVQYFPDAQYPQTSVRLKIYRPIWNKLAIDQKVSLLFHEFLLAGTLEGCGRKAAEFVRENTGFVLSDQAEAFTEGEWNDRLWRSCQESPP